MAVAKGVDDVLAPRRPIDDRYAVGRVGMMPHPARDLANLKFPEHRPRLFEKNVRAVHVCPRSQASEFDIAGNPQAVVHRRSDELAVGRDGLDALARIGAFDHDMVAALALQRNVVAERAGKVARPGAGAVGKLLQKQAADTLKRCTMELGGHAPVIVHEDADLEKTLDTVVAFKFRNAGQVCTSPTRFYVHEAVYDRFIDGFATRAEKLRIGDGLDANVQMGPMIAPRRLDAMDAFVSDATAKGATVVTGGKRIGNKGYFYAPTLLKNVPDTARIMSEEPFGPIAPTTPFSTFDDMIERANSLPYGLASFVFTRNLSLAPRTEVALEAGMAGVNHMMVSTPETPFGGVNESGYGSESGIEGLDAYLRTKFVTEM